MNYKKVYDNIIERAKNRKIDNNIYSEKHHIIPVSLGGLNTKENLVRLYPREHYIAHLLLYKHYDILNVKSDGKYRNEYIKMLWALSALYYLPSVKTEDGLRKRAFTGNAHIYAQFKEKYAKEACLKLKERMKNLSKNEDEYKKYCKKISEGVHNYLATHTHVWVGKHHSDETKIKIGKKSAIHQKGKGNSQYNTMWITNIKTGEDKKIKKDEIIPEGWEKGRGGNKNKHQREANIIKQQQIKEQNKNNWIDKLRPLYKEYKINGYKGIVQKGWNTSIQNFLVLCKKYLSEYEPSRK